MGSQKPLEYKTPNMRRVERNLKDSEALRKNGYDVHTSDAYPNNAYYAIEQGSVHLPHEEDTVAILAENGISTTLLKEGTVIIDGNTMPSFDGAGHGLSFEIRETEDGKSVRLGTKVADAISHSKKSHDTVNYVIQADVAVSYTKNPYVHETQVLAGIDGHSKRKPEKKGNPKFLLQVDGIKRKVYFYKINGSK